MALYQRIPSYLHCGQLAGGTSCISISAVAGYAGVGAALAPPAANRAVWRRIAPVRRIGPSGRPRTQGYGHGARPRSEPAPPGTRPGHRRRRGAGCARTGGRPRGRRPTIRRAPSAFAPPGSVRDLCSPSPPVSPHPSRRNRDRTHCPKWVLGGNGRQRADSTGTDAAAALVRGSGRSRTPWRPRQCRARLFRLRLRDLPPPVPAGCGLKSIGRAAGSSPAQVIISR